VRVGALDPGADLLQHALAVRRGHELQGRPPAHVRHGQAQHGRQLGVAVQEHAVLGDGDGLERGLGQVAEALLAIAQRVLGFLAPGDVAQHRPHRHQPALRHHAHRVGAHPPAAAIRACSSIS
jgi:hypothetical protein